MPPHSRLPVPPPLSGGLPLPADVTAVTIELAPDRTHLVVLAETVGGGTATRRRLPLPATGGPVVRLVLDPLSTTVRATSAALLQQAGQSALVTQRHLQRASGSHHGMLVTMFVVGIATFLAAVVTALQDREVAATAIFGGLSAVAFVGIFLTDPTQRMGRAGPEAAWAQAITTTYWSKLAYMVDPATALQDLDAAQESLARAFTTYFQQTQGTPTTTAPAPADGTDGAAPAPADGTHGTDGTPTTGAGAEPTGPVLPAPAAVPAGWVDDPSSGTAPHPTASPAPAPSAATGPTGPLPPDLPAARPPGEHAEPLDGVLTGTTGPDDDTGARRA